MLNPECSRLQKTQFLRPREARRLIGARGPDRLHLLQISTIASTENLDPPLFTKEFSQPLQASRLLAIVSHLDPDRVAKDSSASSHLVVGLPGRLLPLGGIQGTMRVVHLPSSRRMVCPARRDSLLASALLLGDAECPIPQGVKGISSAGELGAQPGFSMSGRLISRIARSRRGLVEDLFN